MKYFFQKWIYIIKIIFICIHTSRQVNKCVYFDFELHKFYVIYKGKKYELVESFNSYSFEPMF